ncbi:MAG: putative secreted mucin [Candidatus Pacebacteria bacterium GW2011_GWA1_46_10]|nr:MAG: putative secreted mucin [Candidatus Pacebacteria bacterium GW2011_GWA1_46_10]
MVGATNLQHDLVVAKTSGNVGIGTTAPDTALEINHATGNNLRLTYNDADGSALNYTDFTLDSSGNLTINSSGTQTTVSDTLVLGTAGAGTTDSVIVREAGGDLAARSIDSRVWGSSLVDGSGTANYVTYWSDSNTLAAEQYLATSRGGLGGNVTALGAGEVLYSTSTTAYDSLAAGSSGQLLTSGGAAAPSWSNIASLLTAGDDILLLLGVTSPPC